MKDMSRLFSPRSVAVVGASEKPGMGRGASEGALQSSIADRAYFVNIKRDAVLGRRCYHSLAELPEVVDTVVLCVNSGLVNGYLEEAGRLGVKNAVVYASGFSEEGSEEGRRLEREMHDICERYGMLLVGPNCVGLYNKVDRISLYATDPLFPEQNIERGIGAVAHSGYINSNLMRSMPDICAYGVSVGNSAVCTLEEYMLYYAENEHVNCIAAYIEGIRDTAVFEQALRTAAEKRKPVVVMKSGRSKKGSAAAASHTGNLAGDYPTFEALLLRYGVVLTDSLEEFNSTARMFAVLDGRYPKKGGLGAVNFSGGENTICADLCEQFGLELPMYEEATRETVQSVIPAFSTARNPLDPTTEMFSEHDRVKTMFEAIFRDENIDMFVLGLELTEQLAMKDKTCIAVLKELAAEGKLIPSFIAPSFEKARCREAVNELQKLGVPVLSAGVLAYKILASLVRFVNYDASRHTLTVAGAPRVTEKTTALSEGDSKAEISAQGVRVPGQFKASGKAELRAGLAGFRFPVVIKIDSPDILHKTEAGGVALGIGSVEEAEAAFDRVLGSCRAFDPDARLDGVLVQEMLPDGVEMIVGVKNDRQYGPMLLCGMGGIYVEVFRDAALAPCPVNLYEARAMVDSLKSSKLLYGYRGSAECDVDALCELLVKVSEYAAANSSSLSELDLNPVRVFPKGCGAAAADALIVKYQ